MTCKGRSVGEVNPNAGTGGLISTEGNQGTLYGQIDGVVPRLSITLWDGVK
jgi:hypothetical protein